MNNLRTLGHFLSADFICEYGQGTFARNEPAARALHCLRLSAHLSQHVHDESGWRVALAIGGPNQRGAAVVRPGRLPAPRILGQPRRQGSPFRSRSGPELQRRPICDSLGVDQDVHGSGLRRRTDSLIMNYAKSDEHGAREATMTVVYADGRAPEFLRREARQLPKGHPGLIMIDSAEAFRAMRTWASALQIRFRPEMYTRVSAICLFENARPTRSEPYRWRIRRQLLMNTHASMELPSQIVSSLTQQSGED
jgi:hypothetical protein